MKKYLRIFCEGLLWVPYLFLFLVDKDFRSAFERLTWDRRRMELFQLEKLKSIVSYAYEYSPLYRDLYDRAGVKPADIQTLSDIEKLPILTKSLVREGIANKTIYTKKRIPWGTSHGSTAGSTGDPMVLSYDLATRKHRYTNTLRSMWMMGALPHKRLAFLWRKKKLSFRQKLSVWSGLLHVVPVMDVMDTQKTALGKDEIHSVLQDLSTFRPHIMRGYTSALWVIAHMVKKYQISLGLEHIITSAEYVPPVWQEEMERVFGCPVHNFYGGTEASPIATSLTGKRDLVVFQDYYGTEIIDKDSQSVGPGQVGRILITDYWNRYMPLIRYEIGDIAEWSDDDSGPFASFKQVQGRINDIFVLPGGKVLFSHNWHIYFRDVASIARCKIIQRTINAIDIFLEVSVPGMTWNQELLDTKKIVEEAIGPDVTIAWNLVDQLPLDAGEKFRTVRSDVDVETILKHL